MEPKAVPSVNRADQAVPDRRRLAEEELVDPALGGEPLPAADDDDREGERGRSRRPSTAAGALRLRGLRVGRGRWAVVRP